MVERRNRKRIVIASKYFINMLGIRTVLSSIGLDAEITEITELSPLDDMTFDYLIINSDVIPEDSNIVLQEINTSYTNKNVMIIGNDAFSSTYKNIFYVNNVARRKEVLNQFQTFIFGHQLTDSTDEGILTEREIDVLKKVAGGNANKEIADKLFISINTVITHRKNITEKLGVKTIAGLTVYAIMHGLINPEEVKF